ncbi:uncharacterized protein PAC_16999 [Phialocephala subalpina]|uniref:Uncharacterized protein n=1 Tax=Phialocephala subalpina TaxID=576137 RepID=A0A1L7XPY6_9HELO|nr:uncharacterized protein PAC_16999 [Phialocephala subalpina]
MSRREHDTEQELFAHNVWADHIIWSLTSNQNLRIKFLNCLAEPLSPTKRWHHVTATALREKSDFVKVDLARNSGYVEEDSYLAEVQAFKATQGKEGTAPEESGSDCHGFLQSTVTFNANRVDKWSRDANEAFHRAQYLELVSKPEELDLQKVCNCESPCIPSCWADTHAALRDLQALATLFRPPRIQDARHKVVLLAGKCTGSPGTWSVLSGLLNEDKAGKLLRALRFLARPITTIRLLAQIARILPHFRTIKFCCLPPPRPTQIAKTF